MERLRPAPLPDRYLLPTPPEALLSLNGQSNPPPVYNTGMGRITFDQLYQKTSRVVGYTMRERLGMFNPEDIDDCMQAGYFKVWQQLQKDPDYFADKPKRYIVQSVIFRTKAQRYAHQRHYSKIVYNADAGKHHSVSTMTARQVDTWIDLERAISHVASQVEDTPAKLLGLYCAITQVHMRDVADTFGHGYSTLNKRKHEVKAALAVALEGYGPSSTNGKPVAISPMPTHPKQPSGLVTTRLFHALHEPSRRIIYQSPTPFSNGSSALVNGHFMSAERHETEPETYPTRWGGLMTLEEVFTDPVVRRSAFAKAGRLGLAYEDQQDCVQQGFIKLWQKLQNDPHLLADKGPVWAGIYIAYSGNPKQFHRHTIRQRTFTLSLQNGQSTDEYSRPGCPSGDRPTHAAWTTEVDEIIDVNSFLERMRQCYASNPRKQTMLQAVTGVISSREAARQLGLHEKNCAASIGNQVREEVKALLPDNLKEQQPEVWKTRLARGEGVEHIAAIAQEIINDLRLLLALYVATTSASKKVVAETFSYGMTAFGKDIRKAKDMIAARNRRADAR